MRAAPGALCGQGTVTLNGLDVTRTPPARLARLRAVLPQDTQVAFPFTVAQIVAMGQEAGDDARTPGLIARSLSAVGLQGYEPRDIHSLSGGERARVHLARVLAQVATPMGPDGRAGCSWTSRWQALIWGSNSP